MADEDAKTTALREAMRLAVAAGELSLRWEDIADRAHVSRATAFRRSALREEWKRICSGGDDAEAAVGGPDVEVCTDDDSKKELQQRLRVMANHIEALVAVIGVRDRRIASLERELARSTKPLRIAG